VDNNEKKSGWSNEFKVGLMTLTFFVVLMVSILFVNNFRFGGGGRVYTATFNFLGDLKADAPVRYAGGIDVGRVKAIRILEGKAAVDMLITQSSLRLRKDSKVAIYSTSMLGSKYVQIEADLGIGEELKSGETIVGHDSNNLDKTFSQLGDVMEAFQRMMGDPVAKENFLKSFENMNKATDQILQLTIASRAKVERMVDELSRSSGDVTRIVASAQKVSKSLEDLTTALNKKDIEQSVKNMNNTLRIMNQLAKDIEAGKGAAGVLLKDEKVGKDLKTLVEELKAHPWRLLWKK
jgi:phospholipid/cholesterol/gamma-HCH transport system substrate-binding protein